MKNQAKRLESYLSGSNVLDWRAFALTQPLFFTFGFITFNGHVPGNPWFVTLANIASASLEVFIAYAFRPLLAPKNKQNSLWRIWLLYWLAGELSSIFDIYLFSIPFRDPAEGVSAWTLVLTNGFLRLEWFTFAHLAVSLIKSDLQMLNALRIKSNELSSLRVEVNGQLARELSGLREAISGKITNALLVIAKQVDGLSSSTPKTELLARASLVSQLCDTEVRALSHEISDREFEPAISAEGSSKLSKPLSAVPLKATEIKLRWQWVAGIGILNAFAIALEHGGWVGAASAVIAIALGIAVLHVIDDFRSRVWASDSATGAIALIVAEYLFASGLILAGLWVVGAVVPDIRHYVQTIYVIVPIVILIIWSLVQAIHEFNRRLRHHGDELAAQIQLLEQEVKLAQAKAAKARNRIGKLLHGTTQGRLASVSLALAAAANAASQQDLEQLLDQARAQLALAEIDLQNTLGDAKPQSNSVDDELHGLVKGWRNLVRINHVIEAGAREFLNETPDLQAAVTEAMQECITNAVRHGQASEIWVELGVADDLYLKVSNDGYPISEIVPGFGIRAISELANKVEFETNGPLTTVTIRWALATV